MKKSTLALAVAAALAASTAYADTTLYGSARVSVDYEDYGTINPFASGNGKISQDSNWDVFNDASRLGVRGEEDLGGGLAAIYQYEFGVDVTDGGNFQSNRPKWVGLKGASWGSVTAGTQWTPYYNVVGVGDIFNSSKTFLTDSYLGFPYGQRMDNMLMYSSPNWSGFGFQVALVMNGGVGNNDPVTPSALVKCNPDNRLPCNIDSGIDMYQLNATYKNGPFFVGATYMALNGPSFGQYFNNPLFTGVRYTAPTWDGSQYALAFGYNSGPFAFTIAWEDGDVNNVYYGKSSNIYVTGQYTFGNNIIRAAYGYLNPDQGNVPVYDKGIQVDTLRQTDINNYLVGYQYNFSKRTRVWVEYLGRQNDTVYGDKNTVSIGTRVDF